MIKSVKLFAAAALIAAVSSVFVGCGAASGTETADEPVKYTLYCGLCDQDAGKQIVTTEEAQETAREIITGKGLGYTEYITHGAYFDDDKLIENATLVYDLMYIEASDVEEISDEIREELNLKPILLVESYGSSRFME